MAPPAAFTYDELLMYTDIEMMRWLAWFEQHPDALDVPFADADSAMPTVRQALRHIFAVEQRYLQRLENRDVTPLDQFAQNTFAEIRELGLSTRAALRAYLDEFTDEKGREIVLFKTATAGVLTASKRKIASNLFTHGIRHWGRIASVLRAAGFRDQWGHDLLLSTVEM